MFFETNNKYVVKNANFLEKFCTLYDLLIYLFDNSTRNNIFTEDEIKFFISSVTDANNCIKRNYLKHEN